ncbi:MAG: hypothetical protein R1F54_01820 [Candidatus Zeuxoniibacter abyssi]|nr:MAG: hypothetical protein R1F54_01820 [Candidatus Persebacteraceae bacterium AB1(2)]
MELLDTKEYEEGLHKMDNKRFWAYIALFILTFSFYGMILVYISNSIGKENIKPFAFLSAIIASSLLLSPIVWVISILNREKSKIWTLLEDVRVKREMTRLANISAFTEMKNKEFILKLMDLHEKITRRSLFWTDNAKPKAAARISLI